eukprot:50853-Eustigmatos_ZCMA.PRE.1
MEGGVSHRRVRSQGDGDSATQSGTEASEADGSFEGKRRSGRKKAGSKALKEPLWVEALQVMPGHDED